MSSNDRIYIGRQPILDAGERVVAYEMLFRGSADAQTAVFTDQHAAAMRVMVNTFASMGADAVLGPCLGFFNVTREVLLGEMIEALPRDRVTLEILEDVCPDLGVERRCRELRDLGFRLALDDFGLEDAREPLLDCVDTVKVDVLAIPESRLPRLMRRLRRYGVRLLAEKVETREQFERCHELGFDLFQGFYFARPVVLEGTKIDPAGAALMNLLELVERDVDTATLCEPFKQNGELGVNLIRLCNSAALARPTQISTVQDAVNFLGRRALSRWAYLLLYAGSDPEGLSSALCMMAARRGRLMELVAAHSPCIDGISKGESAFLTGMLSLLDALLGRPLPDILRELSLDQDIVDALLERTGSLGSLLCMCEELERGEFTAVADRSQAFGLGPNEMMQAELAASRWVHALSNAA